MIHLNNNGNCLLGDGERTGLRRSGRTVLKFSPQRKPSARLIQPGPGAAGAGQPRGTTRWVPGGSPEAVAGSAWPAVRAAWTAAATIRA